ncbi:MAG: L,D-transpeptidase family protein [Andreesenia angusta]|nr:L,D-transpeptidase family protein [Andreesenia angusta]
MSNNQENRRIAEYNRRIRRIKRERQRKKRRKYFKRIRALIILILLILGLVSGVRAIKNKIQDYRASSQEDISSKEDKKTEKQEKKKVDTKVEEKKTEEKKPGEIIKLKEQKELPRIKRTLEESEVVKDDTPARGEALNVIERDGKTKIYQHPSLQSQVVKELNDNDSVIIKEVVPGGWLNIETPSGDKGYAEAVRIRSKKLPDHNYNESSASNVIMIDQQNQKMKIYKDGSEVLESSVSCGIESEFTPKGVFTINKAHSGEWDFATSFGEGYKYFTAFYPHGYLIHSLPMNNNQEVIKEEADKLGSPASHGCIRTPIPVAKYIYENIPDETLVIIE